MKAPALAALMLFAAFALAQQQPRLRVSSFTPELAASIPASDVSAVQDIVRKFTTEKANTACPTDILGEVVRDAFQETGYFKVGVTGVVCRVVADNPTERSVSIRAKVDPGLQYRTGQVTFAQPTRFPTSELRRQVPIGAGDIFDVASVRRGLKNLRDLYCHQGYIDFTPVPNTDVDEAHRTISLNFDLDEGAQFTTGQLIVEGTPSVPGTKEHLLAAWKNYEGKPFDCSLTLKQFLSDIHARPSIDPNRLFRSEVDPQNHVVNVTIVLGKRNVLTATN